MDAAFENNPVIQRIADVPMWTISDNKKMPIDVFQARYKGVISGCNIETPGSTTTLKGLFEMAREQGAQYPANAAFYLDVLRDNIVILDVEPSCPIDLQREFLKMEYLYAERSMSGKGLHLMFEVPENFNDFPDAANKVKIRDAQGRWEILLNHWVTFTGNRVGGVAASVAQNKVKTIEDVYAKLAKEQKRTSEKLNDFTDFDPEESIQEIPHGEELVENLVYEKSQQYKKTLDDFNGDHSRYEYGFLGFKFNRLLILTRNHRSFNDHAYSPEELITLLYAVAVECIPHRNKHDEERQGMPFLMWRAKDLVERMWQDPKEQ